MLWDGAEATIRAYIEAGWALSPFASTIPLAFENELQPDSARYMVVNIEGTFPEKSGYGAVGAGLRYSFEHGIVFFHCFVPSGSGKQSALSPIVTILSIVEFAVLSGAIKFEGATPPSPVETARSGGSFDDPSPSDALVPAVQPEGQYYRCSASVPFYLAGTR